MTNIGADVTYTQFFMTRMSFAGMYNLFNVAINFIKAANFLKNFFTTYIDVMDTEKEIAVIFAFDSVNIDAGIWIFCAAGIDFCAEFVIFQRVWSVAGVAVSMSQNVINHQSSKQFNFRKLQRLQRILDATAVIRL